jgi:signal transduction histidine kinase
VLFEFLESNRSELIDRCRAKVAKRSVPRPWLDEAEHGVPMFLEQLIATLRAEHAPGAFGGLGAIPVAYSPRHDSTAMKSSATRHGRELLNRGFTVDQVVHDYGDLCQAVTELAIEREERVDTGEFRTLNRCLDEAIAGAVTEFGAQRDRMKSDQGERAMGERLGFLAHELRNFLNTAILAFAAIKGGSVAINGSTSAVLDRSFIGLRDLIDRALVDVRLSAGASSRADCIDLDRLIEEVKVGAQLEATGRGCEFAIEAGSQGLQVFADRPMLYSAVSNLLQNAFKYTHAHGRVVLRTRGEGGRVLIEIEDRCGGLPEGMAARMFVAFEQHHADRSGLGLGLSIAKRAVEACSGLLSWRDIPGSGCVFTIDLRAAEAEVR